MVETYLFPPDLGLTVAALTADPAAMHIALATTADLPCLDYAVHLDLQVRRFRDRTVLPRARHVVNIRSGR